MNRIALAMEILATVSVGTYAATPDIPEYVNIAANRIELPATADRAAWHRVAQRLDSLEQGKSTGKVRVMHIGDSHIQAEMGTSVLRRQLQSRYGNAGRGLITAFKLAGTNQPVDYAITAENPVDSQARLLKRPWPIRPGFTGVASSSSRSNRVTFKNFGAGHDFDSTAVFTSSGRRDMRYYAPVDSASFWMLPGERLFGVYTEKTKTPGIVYSAIGNNGATFSDYLLIDGFGDAVARFHPDIVVFSMGTNEGFSSDSNEKIAEDTRCLIAEVRRAVPGAVMVLWTPMECQKNRNHGKTPPSPDFDINKRVAQIRDIMLDVARAEGVAVWDFYDVAGGEGVSTRWIEDGLMNKDRIHLYRPGYELQGRLAADAFNDFIESL